jgi:hypothetical protein
VEQRRRREASSSIVGSGSNLIDSSRDGFRDTDLWAVHSEPFVSVPPSVCSQHTIACALYGKSLAISTVKDSQTASLYATTDYDYVCADRFRGL